MSEVAEQHRFLVDAVKLLIFLMGKEDRHEIVVAIREILKHEHAGFTVTGGELHRSKEQQEFYVQTGRSRTMASNHLRRCALDLNFFQGGKLTYDKAKLQAAGEYWESLDPKNRWGGNWSSFVDVPHFERHIRER